MDKICTQEYLNQNRYPDHLKQNILQGTHHNNEMLEMDVNHKHNAFHKILSLRGSEVIVHFFHFRIF